MSQPVTIRLLVNYNGKDNEPSVEISNTDTSTYSKEYVINGRSNKVTDFLKVTINGVDQIPFTALPPTTSDYQNWSYTIPALNFGVNNYTVQGINNKTGQTATISRIATLLVPIATEYAKMTLYVSDGEKYRLVNPRVMQNGKAVQIATYIGIMSSDVAVSGVLRAIMRSVGAVAPKILLNPAAVTGVVRGGTHIGTVAGHNLYAQAVDGVRSAQITNLIHIGTVIGKAGTVTIESTGTSLQQLVSDAHTTVQHPTSGYWAAPSGNKIISFHIQVSALYDFQNAFIKVYNAAGSLLDARTTDTYPINLWVDCAETDGLYIEVAGNLQSTQYMRVTEVKTVVYT